MTELSLGDFRQNSLSWSAAAGLSVTGISPALGLSEQTAVESA